MSRNLYVENSQYQVIFCAALKKARVFSLLFLIPAISLTYPLSGPDNPNPDINGDGVVDVLDLVLVAKHFGIEYEYDNDTELEFYWSPATGNVSYYEVYLFVYDSPDALGPRGEEDYVLVDNTSNTHGSDAPKKDKLYTLPGAIEPIEYGKGYQIQVAAVDASNDAIKIVGPRSEPSKIVFCAQNENDLQVRWDLNKDKVCDILDIEIIGSNLGKSPTSELHIKAKTP